MATEISIEDSSRMPLLDKSSKDVQVEQILPWKQQLTLRGLFISALLGTVFSLRPCFISVLEHRIRLTKLWDH